MSVLRVSFVAVVLTACLVLSGPALQRIEDAALESLIVTDTIPLRPEFETCSKIRTLSVARLLGKAIESIHQETSVSSLFV